MKKSIDSTSSVIPRYEDSAALLNSNSEAQTPVVNDNHDSSWSEMKYGSNILYAVGMLAFMTILPLIPGISARVIIIGIMCVIIGLYTAAGIMAVIRARHRVHHPARRRKMT